MTPLLTLRGITWNHARGYAPMEATAQKFHVLHPGIKIVWEKHSLKDFEDYPIEKLAADYDLIVLDHPSISHAARSGSLLPLDEHLARAFLADQAANSVGDSHRSYAYAGHHWALAIDAAAPIAFWRDDLLARLNLTVPRTWPELIALARKGHVEVPAAPINCFMNFYSLALDAGGKLFASAERVVQREAGLAALLRLRELLSLCDEGCWSRNPIGSHDLVASDANTRLAYCPLAYGYSNYARDDGFAAHRLTFGEPPQIEGQPLRTVLGGAGLAVSAVSSNRREAVAYAEFVASSEVQRTLYTRSGGQPGHRSAWLDQENNHFSHDYFKRTLGVLDRAYVRPQFDGYIHFQEQSSPVIQAALRGTLPDHEALTQIDTFYRAANSPTPHSP